MQSPDPYTQSLPQSYPLEQVLSFFEKVLPEPKIKLQDHELESEPVNPQKNNTIIMDVQRTRSSFFPKDLRPQMQKLLVHFCRLQKLQYKQGMNEILAPFAYFRTMGVTLSRCYHLFRAFFDQYCLNFYYDKDFNSLEIIFKMVTVTIKYHDPALARFLQNYDIEPQIYCIGWLMTLFSSKLSLRMTYTLWQYMAAEKDDYFIFFIIIAIIISRREEIIQTKSASIFSIITNLIFKDEIELLNTIKIALLLRKTTPASLIIFFREHRIFKERTSFQRTSYLLKQIDQLNLFLVGPLQVSLKQHFALGFCEKHCYFCSLKQPIKLNFPQLQLHFPALQALLSLSNDIRSMQHSIEFILVDMRGNKSKKLPSVPGIKVHTICSEEPIEATQARFNQLFMQSRGREHFLFLLNSFSFEQESSCSSQEFYFCQKIIKIMSSYSYCYLSILEGGQSAYALFLKDLRLKSEIINSKLHPVSQYLEDLDQPLLKDQEEPIVGRERMLEISEIVTLQTMTDQGQLRIFEGEENSVDYLLIITPSFLMTVERNGLFQRLAKFIRQHKSIITHLIQQSYVLQIPLKIVTLHSLFRTHKLTARVHHNNCLLFYLTEHPQQRTKRYHRGQRRQLWSIPPNEVVAQDLQYSQDLVMRRLPFDTMSYDVVKQVSLVVKRNFRLLLKAKREIQQQLQRVDDFNKNVIQECDFGRKDFKEVIADTDFDF